MKKLIFVLVLALAGIVRADYIGEKLVTDTIESKIVFAIDATGLDDATPDSVHVGTKYLGARDTMVYFATYGSWGAFKASGYADSTTSSNTGGYKYICFKSVVSNIDGSSGNGLYRVTITVWSGSQPTFHDVSFDKVSSKTVTRLDSLMTRFTAALAAKLDSIRLDTNKVRTKPINMGTDALSSTGLATSAVKEITQGILADTTRRLALDASGRVTTGDSTSIVAPLLAYLPDSTRDVVGDSIIRDSTRIVNAVLAYIPDSTRDITGDSIKFTDARLIQFDSLTNNRIPANWTSFNIGINWGDISNPTSSVDLSNTKMERVDTAWYKSASQNTTDSLKSYYALGVLLTSVRLSKLDSLHFSGDSVKATGSSGSGMSLAQFIAWANSDTGLITDSTELANIIVAFAGGAALDSTDSIAIGRWIYQYTSSGNRIGRLGDSTSFQGAAASLDSGVVQRILNTTFTAAEAESIFVRLLRTVTKTDSLRIDQTRLIVFVDSIYANTIGGNAIAANAISSAKINDGAITNGKIASGALDDSKFTSSYFDSLYEMISAATSNWTDSLRDTTISLIKTIQNSVTAKALKYNIFTDSNKYLLVDGSGNVSVYDIDKDLQINLADGAISAGKWSAGAIESTSVGATFRTMLDRHSQDTIAYVTVGAAATLTDSLLALIAQRARDSLLLTVMQPGWPQSGDTLSAWLYYIIAAVVDKTLGIGLTVDNNYSATSDIKIKTDSLHFKGDSTLATGGGSPASSDTASIKAMMLNNGLGACAGTGDIACTLIVRDADSALVEGASITIKTLDQTTIKAGGVLTDINGQKIISLVTGSFYISIRANNLNFVTDTIDVTQDSSWNFRLSGAYVPIGGGDPDKCIVYGQVMDIEADTAIANAIVTVQIPGRYQPLRFGNRIITPTVVSDTSDTNGRWQFSIIPNADYTPATSKYLFEITMPDGIIFHKEIAVPDSAQWEMEW